MRKGKGDRLGVSGKTELPTTVPPPKKSRRKFIWLAAAALGLGVAYKSGIMDVSTTLQDTDRYKITYQQTYPESQICIVYLPDIHREEYQNINKNVIDDLLGKISINVVGLEGFTEINPHIIRLCEEVRSRRIQEQRAFAEKLIAAFPRSKYDKEIKTLNEMLQVYESATDDCDELNGREPGLEYAKYITGQRVQCIGVEEKEMKRNANKIVRWSYQRDLLKWVQEFGMGWDQMTSEQRELTIEMKDKLERMRDDTTLVDKAEFQRVVVDTRSRIAVTKLAMYLNKNRRTTGLLVYGAGHQEVIRQTLEGKRISYAQIEPKR